MEVDKGLKFDGSEGEEDSDGAEEREEEEGGEDEEMSEGEESQRNDVQIIC